MVLIKSFVLAAAAAVATARSAVMDLTPSNFDKVVLESGKPTLVEFFAPWCGHCKNLAPVYEELALAFEHAKDKVQIAKVDADAERGLGKRFGIQGFPTLKYFDGKSEKPEEYKSGRDLESLTQFLTEKAGVKAKKKLEMPSEVVMLTDKSFAETIGSEKNVLVAFTAPWCGHCKNLAPTWESLAADFVNEANVVIAKVDAEAPNSKAVATKQGVSSYPTIKWFPAGSEEGESYDGARSEDDFIKFINKKAGTHRVVGGGLDRVAGTIAALDALVAKFTGGAKLEDIVGEVKSAVEKFNDDAKYAYAKYYVRVFDKLSKSDNYVSKELSRLEGILEKGGLAPSKRDEIQSKTNVLRRFAEKAADKAEELKDEL
ncbi:Protein disulfide-isomerase erp38 [Metarhizium acridum]|uniref:protein disulfide-isomerase n=1 Tax=Metarhizium acridum (strain CQMa 102) TaxID=655827 RepID=E9EEU4_METAQ|nr:protein disulfide-isomerase tigA precursor [Metarhizium acridum CQMa 102]EFY85555.1 protein disulfide-isomerase tigA precursor [Metarhizium acridum CQMa 102]KAG8412887.1 Protein disulfide-isomerase erp38 [Metarhizium acridum]